VTGGELTLSVEGLDLRCWAFDEVPRWHATHGLYARAAAGIYMEEKHYKDISD
jgi:hypothetical protein